MTAVTTQSASLTPDRLVYDLKIASEADISPNGQRVVYVVSEMSRETGKPISQVWISDIDGGNQRQLTRHPSPHSNPKWSPDGEAIAYVANRVEGDGSGIFVLPLEGGEAREITAHVGGPSQLTWSPNGDTLAYILTVDPDNPDETKRPDDQPAPVRVVKRPDYKQDGRGLVNDVRQQLFVVDVETGTRRQLTSAANDHTGPDWNPDGTTVGVQRSTFHGLYHQLVLIDLATGAETVVGERLHTIRDWHWTQDGASLLLIEAPHYAIGAALVLRDIATGTERTIASDFDWSPFSILGWKSGTEALLEGLQAGRGGLWTINTGDATVKQVASHPASGAAFVENHPAVVLNWNGSNRAGELAVCNLDTGETTFITHLNDAFFTETPSATIERRQVENEGFAIEYWLTTPVAFDPQKRYPIILDIHGGPHGAHGDGVNRVAELLAARGYIVVSPNPRGSGSYGDTFTEAVIGDWAGGDWRDLLAALDDALTLPYADSGRTGVYGYSYGGYMSAWAIGQTSRFKAAVIGAPITDLIANYGTADIGHHGGEFQWGGPVRERWEHLQERSPITYAHKATTPGLLLHPEEDQRCPISGSEQLFISLLHAGVETELVRYPGQSHGMLRSGPASYRVDFYERLLGWFDRFLATGSPSPEA